MKLAFSIPLIYLVILTQRSGPSFHVSEHTTGAYSSKEYRILLPTGQKYKGFPLLKPMQTDDPQCERIWYLFNQTFLRDMIRLNDYFQTFLIRKGIKSEKEPLYLLLSGRMGGYPMKGFFLKEGDRVIDKTTSSYVDLPKIGSQFNALNSITQIYPHELAHTFLHDLTRADPVKQESWSSDVHYYSIATDYIKAFNEGFAESFENISRQFEKDTNIQKGIAGDVDRIRNSMIYRTRGFEHDFGWPLRVGYYRMTMLLWYQQLEDFKRYIWTQNGLAKYTCSERKINCPETAILYRNSAVIVDTMHLRTLAQSLATEGVINTFFTRMMESDLKVNYQDRSFYFPFVWDTTTMASPQDYFLPLHNQLLKVIFICHKYLRAVPRGSSPFITFIEGYISEFPNEALTTKEIFHSATGYPYSPFTPPELWLLNRDHSHNALVLAQFGGAKIPFYTINLNTATVDDIRTFRYITRADASRIIHRRDSLGWFRSFDDLKAITGIHDATVSILASNKLNPDIVREFDKEGDLNIVNILRAMLKRLLIVSLILLIPLSLLQYIIFYRQQANIRKVFYMILRNLFKVFMFVLSGLFSFLLPWNPLYLFHAFLLVILGINWIRNRKNPLKLREVFFSSLVIAVIIGFSLI